MKGEFKIGDSSPVITKGSRADQYWKNHRWKPYFQKVRPGITIPPGLQINDPETIAKKFKLRGIGFGNWVTLEDRVNYLFSLIAALVDLNKVLKFNYNLGFDLLVVTFGARGQSGALAHFEPHTNYINITRYEDPILTSEPKEIRFFSTGGLGSFAHEYGHFLDYVFGGRVYYKNGSYSLTGGRSVSTKRMHENQKYAKDIHHLMDSIMEKIFWEIPGKKPSRYYKRLKDSYEKGELTSYWMQRNEIFARAFEVYITEALKSAGIRNRLLTKTKNAPFVYLKPNEFKSLQPLFNKLIAEMRAYIK